MAHPKIRTVRFGEIHLIPSKFTYLFEPDRLERLSANVKTGQKHLQQHFVLESNLLASQQKTLKFSVFCVFARDFVAPKKQHSRNFS